MTAPTRRLVLGLAAAMLATPTLAQKKSASPGGGIGGVYRAAGRNPDGSAYSGTTEIVQQGDAVEFTWRIEGDTTRGSGVLEGRVVTVDWGDATPVVYVIMPDGELHGTWADGTALEKLTPQ